MTPDLSRSAEFQKAKQGNREAFDELFSQQAAPLRLFLHYRMGRKLRSAMESMDLVQDVYIQAFQSFPSFRGKSSADLHRWLCGIANHQVSDHLRALGAKKRGGDARFVQAADSSQPAPAENAKDLRPGPRTLACLRETGAQMESAFQSLPERDQEVIGLRQFEGLSARKTGERLGLTESAVNTLYFRALKRWRESIDPG